VKQPWIGHADRTVASAALCPSAGFSCGVNPA
jgi:hypothetical protein